MDKKEQELLRSILPEGYELHVPDDADGHQGEPYLWHPDSEWQCYIRKDQGIKEAILMMLNERWENGFVRGQSKVRSPILTALGIDAEMVCLRNDLNEVRSEVRELNGRDVNRQRR